MTNENERQLKRKKKYKRGTFFLILFFTILIFTMDLEQNSGAMCGSCHSMKPQHLTWQVSSHSNTGCAECHTDTGLDGNIQLLKDLARYSYREVTGTYIAPIRLFTKVEDERCLRCHNTDRQVSSMGDIFIPHQAHYDSKVRCESCHRSVAHGGIARKGETKLSGLGWNEDRAVIAMAWENTAATMDDCMQCHFRRKVSTDCRTCHTGLNLPEYHQITNFNTKHGFAARTELEDCNICHGYAGTKKLEIRENTTVRDYSRENTFCKACHSIRPTGHTDRWNSQHGRLVGQGGEDGCLICHDNRDIDSLQLGVTNCGSCHPSTHKKGFQMSHWPEIKAATRPNSTCYTCHPANRCTTCHGSY
jgi:nitrate/TMAO reductase-like tetraheme cytochrome c subunit